MAESPSHLLIRGDATQSPRDILILEACGYIDRGIRPYARKYPGLVDEFRSKAQVKIVQAAPQAMRTANPLGYMLIVMTNAFKVVERGYLRERKRWNTQSLEAIAATSLLPPSFIPSPEVIAMFREAVTIRNAPLPTPPAHAIQPHEWEIFRSVVANLPDRKNREIADAFNRRTGRKLNQHSVWTHRKRMGI